MRCRGLNELGDCLRLDDDYSRSHLKDHDRTIKGKGARLLRRGIRRYVKIRITGLRPRRRRRKRSITTLANTPLNINMHTYTPSQFRHTTPLSTSAIPLPNLLEATVPDLERWLLELWHDFLIEPTPYLIASAICYLGGLLVVLQYYAVLWRVVCFFLQFVPFDDEFGLG